MGRLVTDEPGQLARAEPDPEIQELIARSGGPNAGLDFLPGALPYTPAAGPAPAPGPAAEVVWFDALVTNVDRAARNPNLLLLHGRLWLIDHGSALYLHHGGLDPERHARRPFPGIREHVLLRWASELREVDDELAAMLTPAAIEEIVALIPDSWLGDEARFPTADAHRAAYREWLTTRLTAPRAWVEEAVRARTLLV